MIEFSKWMEINYSNQTWPYKSNKVEDSYPNPQTRTAEIPSVRARKMLNRLKIFTLQDLAKHNIEELKTTPEAYNMSESDWQAMQEFLNKAGLSFQNANPWNRA